MEEDLIESVTLLSDIAEKSCEVQKHIAKLVERIENGLHDVSEMGVDFLNVKCSVMASYLADLSNVILLKSTGKSIQNDKSLHRLVENRTVLEKMKPIDDRLKYQITKFVQAAITGTPNANDPMRLKPNPSNMVSKIGGGTDEENEDADEDEDSSDEEKKTKAYVPPKLAPAHFEGDLSAETRREIHVERAKRRALNTGLMRDLQAEYSEAPIEIVDAVDVMRTKTHKVIHDKTDFEEERFIRLPETKKEKHMKRSLQSMASLDSLTHFRDVSALQSDSMADPPLSKKRKNKTKSPKAGSAKKKKRRKLKH